MINVLSIELNLGRDWDIKITPSGKMVAKSSGFVDGSYKDARGEWVKKGDWADIEFWIKDEAWLKGTCKGSRVLIVGKLAIDSWEKDGVKKIKVIIKVENLVQTLKPSVHAPAPTQQEPDQYEPQGHSGFDEPIDF